MEMFHVIQISVLRMKTPTGCRTIDVKQEIEQYLMESQIPYSSLRSGTYMNDMFKTQLNSIRKGKYAPILSESARICLTDPRDLVQVAIVVIDHPVNGHIDVIDPKIYNIHDIQQILQEIFQPSSTMTLFPPAAVVHAGLTPAKLVARFVNTTGYSVLCILQTLYRLEFIGDAQSMLDHVPNIKATRLVDYLEELKDLK